MLGPVTNLHSACYAAIGDFVWCRCLSFFPSRTLVDEANKLRARVFVIDGSITNQSYDGGTSLLNPSPNESTALDEKRTDSLVNLFFVGLRHCHIQSLIILNQFSSFWMFLLCFVFDLLFWSYFHSFNAAPGPRPGAGDGYGCLQCSTGAMRLGTLELIRVEEFETPSTKENHHV